MDELVFVYGTLRSDSGNWRRRYMGERSPVARARIRGRLFDVGEYPCVVPGDGRVAGEVYRIDEPGWLAELDALEGCSGAGRTPGDLYYRQRAQVVTEEGATLVAWVYFWNGELDGLKPILGGDYIAYLRG